VAGAGCERKEVGVSKSPAFQLYVSDFLGSAKVGMMSAEEVGAYLLLLCLDWQEGGFVHDPKRLAKWCRLSPAAFRRAWEQISQCFAERDGRLWNPRLELERAKQAAWRKKAALGAATTNEKRRNGARHSDHGSERGSDESPDAVAPSKRAVNERTPFPSPTPSPTPGTTSSSSSPDVARLLAGLPDDAARQSWEAEIRVATQGMHGAPLSDEQVNRACRDYVGNGHLALPSLRHFRAFLVNAGKPAAIRSAPNGSRPSKQEVGRRGLQEWLAESDAPDAPDAPAGGSNGE
jgi:uncharacterized protein YdaU (DUF1376 family)